MSTAVSECMVQHLPSHMIRPEERYSGVRSLWLKVIIRAMFDWASYRDSPKLQHRKIALSAHDWLFSPSDLFNSFENVCRFLSIDPNVIREKAMSMSKDDVMKIEFRERKWTDRSEPKQLPEPDEEDF